MVRSREPMPPQRKTWQRQAVRDALAEHDGFVSAQTLHAQMVEAGQKLGLATVYRALASLASMRDADSIFSDDGELLYRACSTDDHHHHLICRECGATVEISGEAVESWASATATEHGYTNASHVVDVFGECGECREAAI